MGHRLRRNITLSILLASLAVNVLLVTQLAPLLPYYRDYWGARSWIRQNVLRRHHPDTGAIFNSSEFVLNPAPRPTPRFRVESILLADDPYILQDELRRAVVEVFALERIPKGRLDFVTYSSEEFEGYVRHRVSYQTQVGVNIPAFLLEPSGSSPPWPAVVVVHGCGYGKAGVVGDVSDGHNDIGVRLVRAGILVLAPDRRGFGELQPVAGYVTPSCGAGARDGRALLEADANAVFGTSLRALDVFDLIVAIDYLAARADVTGVGVAGLSRGGVVAEYAAGISNKVGAVVLSNSIKLEQQKTGRDEASASTRHEPRFPPLPETPLDVLETGCPSCRAIGLSSLADDPGLVMVALLPSTPVLIQYGDRDTVNYLNGGPQAIQFIRDIYEMFGAAEQVDISVEPGGHEFFPGPVIDFIRETLD